MPDLLSAQERETELRAFARTRSGREKPGRYWKIDLETLETGANGSTGAAGRVEIEGASPRVIACDLETAARDHAELLARAFRRAIEPQHKFAHLALAHAGLGAFIYVCADCALDDPIVVRYRAAAGGTIFPYTVVLAERGAQVTIVERLDLESGAFVCGVAEVVTGENAEVTYASAQFAPPDARIVFTRAARPGRDARISWASAELGAQLSVSDLTVAIEQPGVDAKIAALFFPTGSQHVDIVSSVDHRSGDATSETLIKSAAAGRGQGRYLGNIRIAPHAQHSDASLRDDALLLSQTAHIDSVPALEIAANEVKAYHGATVGALDPESIFYMTSRGIERNEAERMIALGFFEPAIDRFPTESLREELRAALQAKVTA
ncbi:MAG TPA: Fe-S cluster assembly protein SufD [Candidatus Baltobacteraceae bacterium]|nr:Fe-S cluster assembly protein SufD [Candidatus Baltobacteraceae bacterium]